MQNINVNIISPEEEIYKGSVEMIIIPGEDGDLAAMYEHAPLITYLRPGKLDVIEEEKKENSQPQDNKGDEISDTKKPEPQAGKLSPQQIKNLLEAMNNEEKKVQEKVNASKKKGVKVKSDKDW